MRVVGNVPVGTRVRVVGDVWPERQGCLGTVVAAPRSGIYPGGRGDNGVLVLLDDDPLKPEPSVSEECVWSCRYARKDLVLA